MAAWRDNFEILGRLGAGTSGVVWLARERDLGREVAVKELAPELLAEAGAKDRLRDEARVLARLDDPHCVKVFSYLEDDGSAAIVMEHVPGVSLRSLLARGPLTVEQSLGVLEGALCGLAAAHGEGLVHGDVKPENILVGPDGVSKLVDFGLAVAAGEQRAPGTGSPAYASPEAIAGGPVDARSDLYSAGLVLYELLTGTVAPGGGLAVAAGLVGADLPDPVKSLVGRSLSVDVAARPGTAAAFLEELRRAAEEGCGSDWRDRALLAALVAAALLGAGGALGLESAVAATAPRRRRWRRVATSGTQAGAVTAGVLAGQAAPAGAERRWRRLRRGAVTSGARAGLVTAGAVAVEAVGSTAGRRRWRRGAAVSGAESAAFLGAMSSHPWWAGGTAALVVAGSVTAGVLLSSGTVSPEGPPPPAVGAGGGATGPGGGGAPVAPPAFSPSSGTGGAGTGTGTGGGSVGGSVGGSGGSSGGRSGGGAGSGSGSRSGSGSGSGAGGTASSSAATTTTTTASAPSGSPVTWTIQAELPNYFLYDATCPNLSDCWAAGYDFTGTGSVAEMYATTDGGTNWAGQTIPAGSYSLSSVSCPNASDCTAVDTLSTADGGQTWLSHADPTSMYLASVSCPSATECMAAGVNETGTAPAPAILESTDAGATWRALSLPPVSSTMFGSLTAIDCPTVAVCTAVGTLYSPGSGTNDVFILGTADGGSTWTVEHEPSSLTGLAYHSLSTISCPTATDCWMGGSESTGPGVALPLVIGTSDGGATWEAETVTTTTGEVSGFSSLSCPTTSECWAVGSGPAGAVAYVTQDGGATWHEQFLPGILQSSYSVATSISCPDASACWVLGTVRQGLVGASPQGTVIVAMTGTQLVAQQVPSPHASGPPEPPRTPYVPLYGLLAAVASLAVGRRLVRRRRAVRPAA